MGTKTPAVVLVIWMAAVLALAQSGSQVAPPARSRDEAVTLGYMRTVLYAEKDYKKKHGDYATSLPALVHYGSFTKRMATADRGTYTVHFHGKPESFSLSLVPKQFDADHRAFYADETGKIRVEDSKTANAESPLLK